MLLVPRHKQTSFCWQRRLREEKKSCRADVSCCVYLGGFSFARARILYQRGLIRIKCLKAFQTPGDLNNFWLDLQTKQTIMMQACVKMYTAVKQQMPALDVFINVFSSFHQLLFTSSLFVISAHGRLCVFPLQRCKSKRAQKQTCVI